jgi:hypothetical protein
MLIRNLLQMSRSGCGAREDRRGTDNRAQSLFGTGRILSWHQPDPANSRPDLTRLSGFDRVREQFCLGSH